MRDQHTENPLRTQPCRPQSTENKQTENDVEFAIVTFLRARGWRVEKVHVGLLYTQDGRPFPVGTKGQFDWTAKRPVAGFPQVIEYFELEVKAPGKRLQPEQREYQALQGYKGFTLTWADSFSLFESWYRNHYQDDEVRG